MGKVKGRFTPKRDSRGTTKAKATKFLKKLPKIANFKARGMVTPRSVGTNVTNSLP